MLHTRNEDEERTFKQLQQAVDAFCEEVWASAATRESQPPFPSHPTPLRCHATALASTAVLGAP